MPHLVRWNEELSDFGLVIVGLHVQKATPEEIRAKARPSGVNFAVVSGGSVEGGRDYKGIPHCMLFDHTGKCLYRGSPSSVEAQLRAAVGSAAVARTGKTAFGRALAPLADALKKGQPPAAVLQRAVPLQRSGDAAAAEEAKLLVKALTESGQRQVEEAGRLMKDEPVTAYEQLRRAATAFKGTPVAAKAEAMLAELKNDKAVAAEVKARPSLESIKRLDAQISAKAGGADPKSAEFQRAFALPLSQMRGVLQQMKKSYPDAKATQEAVAIAERYGVK
jgi:hypothetical protein